MADGYGRTAITDEAPRCWRCNRLLALLVTRPWRIACPRCKAVNQDAARGEGLPSKAGETGG